MTNETRGFAAVEDSLLPLEKQSFDTVKDILKMDVTYLRETVADELSGLTRSNVYDIADRYENMDAEVARLRALISSVRETIVQWRDELALKRK